MAFTQAQVDALDNAIAGGLLSVRYGDKVTTYQSMDDMLKARAAMIRSLNAEAKPDRSVPRFQVANFADE